LQAVVFAKEFRMARNIKLLLFLFWTLIPSVGFGSVILLGQSTYSGVDIQGSPAGSAQSFETTIPTNRLVDATAGEFYARTQVTFTQSGSAAELKFDIAHNRSGAITSRGVGDKAQSQQVGLVFSVDVLTRYELSGYYNVTGNVPSWPPGYGRITGLTFSLSELFGSTLFEQAELWAYTPNVHATVGVAGGDTSVPAALNGSLTGILLPGKKYIWSWNAYTYANNLFGGDAGASALGRMSLRTTAAVPEPSSLLIISSGVVCFAALRFRRGVKIRRGFSTRT
jgi:hypothetical protein